MATETPDGPTDTVGTETGEDFVPFLGQFFPESLTLAALLAVVALLGTIPFLEPLTQIELFATGFFRLFTVQMPIILLWMLSATVVESRPVGRVFDWIAGVLPSNTQSKVIYSTGFIALLFGWVNWALGLIGAILIGRKLCRRAEADGTRVHYPLVLTAGLLSLVVTNVGLSSPGALLMTDAAGTTNFLVDPDAGQLVVEMGAFLLHPINLVSSLVLVLTLPLVLTLLAPDDEGERRPISEFATVGEGSIADRLDHYSPPPRDEWVFADRLEQSKVVSAVAFLLGAASVGAYFAGGGGLTLLWLLFALFMLGIMIQQRPMAFVEKTRRSTKWANHVAIPFLLYAAVYALLTEAGLYGAIGSAVTSVGQVSSYAVALVVGLFVPDPGSLWVLQGPALVAAGADLIPAISSVMYGAGVSNLWLGFLFVGIIGSIYGFDWREYVRYAAVVTVYVSVVVIALLIAF
jgi:short subunit fatty acids transporter